MNNEQITIQPFNPFQMSWWTHDFPGCYHCLMAYTLCRRFIIYKFHFLSIFQHSQNNRQLFLANQIHYQNT